QAVDAKEFPKSLQMKAVAATVRILNRSERAEGTGVIVGQKDGALYVLTAAHLVREDDQLEISAFSESSYPNPAKIYTTTKLLARTTRDVRDLALLRVDAPDRAGVMPLCPLDQLPGKEGYESLSVGCGGGKAPICLLEKVLQAKRIRRPSEKGIARF